jgi:mannose-6-phosphate isomerase-like protein (cupin superfamily)
MDPIVVGPGEGERLDAEHLIKLSLPQIDVLEFTVGPEYEGPGPHFHERHVDSFHVLEGELEFAVGKQTLRAGPGTSVSVPPGVVHSFTNPGPGGARFLNVHTPGGFAEYMRARFAGHDPDPADFDIHDVDAPGGSGTAVVTPPAGGERFERPASTITIRTDTPELGLFELEAEPAWNGVDLHRHDDHADSFFVLSGEAVFLRRKGQVRAAPGTLVSAPVGVEHGIGRVDAPARFLNLHAPGAGFADNVRRGARRRAG